MKTTPKAVAAGALAALSLSFLALPALGQDRKVKNAEEERIEAAYRADKAKCEAMRGNEKDICEKEAKGKEKVAKAELQAQGDRSPRAQERVARARADAEYDVAKERCDNLSGNEKDACQKEAKAKRDQAVAAAKRDRSASAGSSSQNAARTK